MNLKELPSLFVYFSLFISFVTTSVNAGLIDRGNGLIYDDVLDITWLQNANLSNSKMNWDDSVTWADNLVYGGFDDWRLTKVYDIDSDGCDFSFSGGTDCGYNVLTKYTDTNGNTYYSELAYMLYENLGNVSYSYIDGVGWNIGWDTLNTDFVDKITGNTVSFQNLTRNSYWSGTQHARYSDAAWMFMAYNGQQNWEFKVSNFYAWAVRDGDVTDTFEVPEPKSYILLALALLFLRLRSLK